ncbi:MAG: hypothetical protein RIR34_896, partial [Actinomycetota bacterium]
MLELSTDEARMLALSGLGLRGNISSGNTSSGSKPSRPSAHDVINR